MRAGALVIAALASSALGSAIAAEWRVRPRVSVEETWSDNINLSESNKRTDFVTQVTPGVAVVGRGGRVTLDLDYQLGLVHYARDSAGSRLDHRLQANGNVELLRQRFFVDFQGTAGQFNRSSTGLLSSDLLSVNENRDQFFAFDVSPYVVHHFGNYADGELRYRHARVFNSDAVDTDINGFSASLASGRRFPKLPWTLIAQMSTESTGDGRDSEFRSVDGSLRYSFTRRYALRVNAGYEDNDFASRRSDTSGPTWRITGIWTPTSRTTVEVGFGHRFFGNSFSLDASHRMRRAVFSASYSEVPTTSAERQLASRQFELEDAFGDPIADPGLVRTVVPVDTPTLSDEVLITRRLSANAALRARRTTSTLGLYHERRDFEVSSGDERVFGVNARVAHSLTRNMSASVGGNWQVTDFSAGDREDTLWRFDLSLSRQFNADISGTLTYEHRENDSSVATSSYEENRVNARVTVLF